jgi:hypothetical protein
LEWDSAFFGFRVAQVTGDRLSIKGGRGILEWSQAQTIRCLYFLTDASSPETADAAHKLSFKMVDLRIQFILDRKRRGTATDTKVELRAPREYLVLRGFQVRHVAFRRRSYSGVALHSNALHGTGGDYCCRWADGQRTVCHQAFHLVQFRLAIRLVASASRGCTGIPQD